MAYFDDLPNELLADIINRLAWNPHTLARLCLVSHSLSRVAKEVLYTHIKCPWYGPSVIFLGRTLLDDPELGQKVRELQCDLVFNDYDNWDCSGWQSPNYNKIEVIGKAAIHLENFFEHEENSVMAFVTRGLVHGEAMAYAALILTLLPNLSSLCFSMDEDNDGDGVHDRPIEALFGLYQQTYTEPRDAPRFCRTLDTLRELKVPVDNIALLAFFPLDGLKFLEINFTDRNGRAYQQRQSLPTSIQARTLKELKLVIDCESICRGHGLMPSRLQESISALQVAETPYYPESVEIQLTCCMHARHTRSRHRIATFSSLVAKLYQISSGIERLRVIFDPESTLEDSFDACLGFFHPVTSMDHFSSLQELHVMENFLVSEAYRGLPQRHPRVSPTLLPPQLEKLTIQAPSGKILPWLVQVAEAAQQFQSLRHIELQCITRCGRSAKWFRKHGAPIFDTLKASYISVTISEVKSLPRCTTILGHYRKASVQSVWDQKPQLEVNCNDIPMDWELGWAGLRALFGSEYRECDIPGS